jgi:uncharacterized RDD family membrane protein YckC
MTIKTQPKLLRRSFAAIIDYGLFFTFFFWFALAYGDPTDDGGYGFNNDPKGLIIPAVWLLYFPVAESITGKTLGKAIVGLRVLTLSGNPISLGQAMKRHVLDILELGPVGLVAIALTPEHQRLGDLWAKTIVVGGDTFQCNNCKEQLALTADEISKKEFTCPACQTTGVI